MSDAGSAAAHSVWRRLTPGPGVYAGVLALAMLAAFLGHMRVNGVFACPAAYGGDHYLGLCESTAYGDYDHGAFWFDLEPRIREQARDAEVLFLGNSRLQFGFSAPALGGWFSRQDASFYLLGFSHTENISFVAPLVRELQPRARAYVINADDFFLDHWTAPGGYVATRQDALARYRGKRAWQTAHQWTCERWPFACGDAMSFYRDRETGQWRLAGRNLGEPSGVDRELPLDERRVAELRDVAASFVEHLGVSRECVIFTYVPPQESNRPTMEALAASVGVTFVSPSLEGLRTFDRSHLDRESAQRFTAAFFDAAGPILERCLNPPPTTHQGDP
ncbi:MAG: hypothetical protein K2P58_07875 [Hyphomonadaceae bacterium]|nr:hypothetical protein [Hyphomonadaceae bacterium]